MSKSILASILKINHLQKRFLPRFFFEMPSEVSNSFHLANATIHDNVKWFYYKTSEKLFEKFLNEITKKPGMDLGKARRSTENFIIETINDCNVFQTHFPVYKKNRKVAMVEAICVQNGRHPLHLGSLRFDPDLELDDVKALSFLASFRNAFLGIPLGGVCCGIKVDPVEFEAVMPEIVKGCVGRLVEKRLIGPKFGVFSPELRTNRDIMDVMLDEYITQTKKDESKICVCGKSKKKTGLKDFHEKVYDAMIQILSRVFENEKLMKKFDLEIGWKNKTFIVKVMSFTFRLERLSNMLVTVTGFWKNGHCPVRKASQTEFKMPRSPRRRPTGILQRKRLRLTSTNKKNPPKNNKLTNKLFQELIRYKKRRGTIDGYSIKSNYKKTLRSNCDILLVTSTAKALNCYNAPELNAKVIVEVVNGGITPSAHRILMAKKRLVIPDILLSSAHTLVSYMEYAQDVKTEKLMIG